jgi:hypothetical protein
MSERCSNLHDWQLPYRKISARLIYFPPHLESKSVLLKSLAPKTSSFLGIYKVFSELENFNGLCVSLLQPYCFQVGLLKFPSNILNDNKVLPLASFICMKRRETKQFLDLQLKFLGLN